VKKKNSAIGGSILIIVLFLIQTSAVYAAPVYIHRVSDFPAYPYNTAAYMQGGRLIGCGPTTGAMILAYFEHIYDLTGLLKSPVAGTNEGLATAWELHYNYMYTDASGFGSVYNIKPGLEDYAADRGHQIRVMAHAPTSADPATSWYNDYGTYGDAWMNDGFFWMDLGGDNWDIDPDLFCDFVEARLSEGIAVMLTVDSDGDGGGDHWVPCVGYNKASDLYYYYDTYSTTLGSATIDYCGSAGAGLYGISFVRSIEYIYTYTLVGAKSWYWNSYTYITSVARGDLDGDGKVEVVSGGHYYDGSRYRAQLCVWHGGALAFQNVRTWYWTGTTQIWSVAVGDVDADGNVEIVTGGTYYDGTRTRAQLCVWNGATLSLENVKSWYWTSNTEIWSVAVGDVDADGQVEIVTGGNYWDGTRQVAQLCVWSGATLASEDVTNWYWTGNTNIRSVAVGDVDGDSQTEIVTGGYYHDGTRHRAQLCVWSGATLASEDVTNWYWTGNTAIFSVAVGDVDGDAQTEIVTGGGYNDGTRVRAQLCVFSGATLALENVQSWYWTGNTQIWSVAVGDVDGEGKTEIVTGGYNNDGTRDKAQLCVFSGATLSLENVKSWYWTDDTCIYSVAVGDVNMDGKPDIVTGGIYWDGTRDRAQLCVWA
jgi:hypothetical protein